MKARPVQFQAPSLHGTEPPQIELLGGDLSAPETLPTPADLQPTHRLSAVLERCSNFIYANDGRLKEKAFQELAKLLFAKLWEERHHPADQLRFGVTAAEFNALRRSEPSTFTDRIARVFVEASARHPTLFSPGEGFHLRPLTLAYVVNQLQLVDLSNTNFDIKGLAFQRLVSAAQRGARGEYFTPDPVVRLAVELLRPKADDRVLDPACGSGGFLLATMRHVAHRSPAIDIGAYAKAHLRGIDFNPDIARVARLQLAFYGDSEDSIIAENALLPVERVSESAQAAGTSGVAEESFDIVVTNPPFGKKGRVIDNSILAAFDLGHRWAQTPDGEWAKLPELAQDESPEVLFIERCAAFLRPGGRLAIVLPDGILQNPSAGYVRKWILDHLNVLAVVSLPQEAFVPFGTGVKTSLAIFEKPGRAAATHEGARFSIFFAKVEQIGYDVKGNPIFERDQRGRVIPDSEGQPRIAEDISRIVQLFADHSAGTVTDSHGDLTFTVQHSLLKDLRLDVEHYTPSTLELEADLLRQGAKPLGELVTLVRGRSAFRSKPSQQIRYVAISDVDSAGCQIAAFQEIPAYEAPSRATYRIKVRDILTAVSGASTGTKRHATALVTDAYDGCICSNGFAVLRDVRGVDPLFLLYYLRSPLFLQQVLRRRTGHAIPTISLDDLARVLVLIPPREDQDRLAAEARAIMSLREESRQRGTKLAEGIVGLVRGVTAQS